MKKTFTLCVASLAAFGSVIAQPSLEWARTNMGYNVSSICLDPSGNLYTTGTFRGTVDFDPGEDTYYLTPHPETEGPIYDLPTAVFIQKLNPSGGLIWAKSIDSVSIDTYSRHTITTDKLGNVYITVTFRDTLDIDPGPNSFYVYPSPPPADRPNERNKDGLIVKFNPAGNFLWAKSFSATYEATATESSVDELGNVFTIGKFADTSYTVNNPDGSSSGGAYKSDFIRKHNSDGTLIWSRSIKVLTGNTIIPNGLTVDKTGNSYITGIFAGTIDFGNGEESYLLTSASGTGTFVIKLRPNGRMAWVKGFGGYDLTSGTTLAVDGQGNVITSGIYRLSSLNYVSPVKEIDFDPGNNVFHMTTTLGYWDSEVFIQKLDSLGRFVWTKRLGGEYSDQPFSLAIDNTNNIYLGGASGVVHGSYGRSGPLWDIALYKLSPTGSVIWLEIFGGGADESTMSIGSDYAKSIALSNEGSLYVAGDFARTVDFDPSEEVYHLSTLDDYSNGNFLFKWSDNPLVTHLRSAPEQENVGYYPNPVKDNLTVQLQKPLENLAVEVLDVYGRSVLRKDIIGTTSFQMEWEGAPGVYSVMLSSDMGNQSFKVVKE